MNFLGPKLTRVFYDAATAPAVALATGSALVSASVAGPEAVVLNSVVAATVAGVKIYESVTEKARGIPFGVLSAVNFTTALSIAFNTVSKKGIDAVLQFSPDIHLPLAMVGAYSLWGIRSALLARHDGKNTEPSSFKDNPQWYNGLGNLAASQLDPVKATLAGFGVLKTMFKKAKEDIADYNLPDFLNKHATPARAYALQYFLTALSSGDSFMTAGTSLWAWAFLNFDKKENQSLVPDALKLIPKAS